ncbi:MAG: flavodoxin family protein [Chloroflexi bacterium]|nr:flavodoxin family protein [Chloroflexota bacterium]
MRVLGISGSPRKNGNTQILLEEALASAREAGAEAELIILQGKDIKPCDGCEACSKTGRCHINDDMQPLYDKLLETDAIIFGTPIYFFSMTGQLKVFMDRTYALTYPTRRLANKVGAVITVSARTGNMSAISLFYTYFAYNRLLGTDAVYGFASTKGAIKKDAFAMKTASELGKEVVALIGALRYPPEYQDSITRMVPKKYGIKSSPFE